MDLSFLTKFGKKTAGTESHAMSMNGVTRSIKLWGRNLILFHHKRIEHVIIGIGFLLAVLAVGRFLFLWPTLSETELNAPSSRELNAEVINTVLTDIDQQKIEHDDEIDLPSRVFNDQ